MSFPDILYTFFIGPLETLFELVYILAHTLVGNPGLSIIGLSLVMNLLLLPLYKRTDAIQLEAIETEKRMKPIVTHIKKTFRGDEQFMMLQTCYRQNHYKPTDALKGISPLLLEIPFFMAAYHYLSHLSLLHGASLGPIGDLGAPDGLLVIGGLAINVLPILMTLINVASSLIYTKDAPLRTKLQLYGMAALFLVLLYNSPSGLVFYWTLNNLFSLIKNILMKVKNPRLTVGILSAAGSLASLVLILVYRSSLAGPRLFLAVATVLLLALPLVSALIRRKKGERPEKPVTIRPRDRVSFFSAGLVLTLLTGLLIPAALIHTSPEEFMIMGSGVNPNSHVLRCFLIAAGFFILWLGIFYMLAKPGAKKKMEFFLWALSIGAVINYMCFGRHYGNLSGQLTFDLPPEISLGAVFLNLGVLGAVTALLWLLWRKKPMILTLAGLAAALAMAGMSLYNISQSQKIIRDKAELLEAPTSTQADSLFSLSTQGHNVVVLMLDRAVNGFLPYIFNEKPELQEQFAGFTYYPNTISFGAHTNFGLPAVFGGYEYTPLELNRRDEEPLEEKHNEALRMMPILFRDHGFTSTVCDPTYAGYDWIPDLSIYDRDEGIEAHITMGKYNDPTVSPADSAEAMSRKVLFYSLFKASPVLFHSFLYDDGQYQNPDGDGSQWEGQTDDSPIAAQGQTSDFRNAYYVLTHLPELTEITSGPEDTFLMMCNDTTHSPQLLQMPDYVPQTVVDNGKYEKRFPQRTDWNGDTVTLKKPIQIKHYHCNMAGFLEIGKWLDYLRENQVYDNTRIIIVSDHGYNVHMKPELEFGDHWDEDIMFYNPLLLVKDFGATEFQVDETFMTNADVPTLATRQLLEEPVNPFSGVPITSDAKDAPVTYVFASHDWNTSENHGNTYNRGMWLAVSGDMKDPDNWVYTSEDELP